ncbi:hypothetical protein PTTG_05646 [Puccinia triticina 1-1 BBBD Race 1]|uniref:Retrotransposon Copia-like N-terminal domain-containing protein n=1 Tax=Puccinia triticina (isolate 1-1 / race 1 (BBBD)) TaxID=630390 RepID=A0A180GBY1_PUCT1|nr:hypothetical protein PTTG_05646 [Puccinia triticina 1-1 BBBD Race 1]
MAVAKPLTLPSRADSGDDPAGSAALRASPHNPLVLLPPDSGSKPSKEAPAHLTLDIKPATMSTSPRILTARLPILEAPGPQSNYLDWKLVVNQVFKSAKVRYVLTTMEPAARPVTWEDDNDTVCAILVQIVDRVNLRYCREHADDAAGMWGALSKAHEDSSTGGRVYWIRKLVNTRMDNDDIDAHIDSLAQSHERLNSLVTPDKPLTPDDVHTAALLSSLPPDWIHCVSALMNQEGVKTEAIVKALKNEAIRRESQGEIISVSSTKSKPVNHDLNSCNNTRNLILEHKAAQKARGKASQPDAPSTSSSKPHTRAGRTSAAPVGEYVEVYSAFGAPANAPDSPFLRAVAGRGQVAAILSRHGAFYVPDALVGEVTPNLQLLVDGMLAAPLLPTKIGSLWLDRSPACDIPNWIAEVEEGKGILI